jgi:hypothetical protein
MTARKAWNGHDIDGIIERNSRNKMKPTLYIPCIGGAHNSTSKSSHAVLRTPQPLNHGLWVTLITGGEQAT